MVFPLRNDYPASIFQLEPQENKHGQLLTMGEEYMTRAVYTNSDDPGFPDPGLQACGPGVYCAKLREHIIRPIRNEPQIHLSPAELSACNAYGITGNADIVIITSLIYFTEHSPLTPLHPNPVRHSHDHRTMRMVI